MADVKAFKETLLGLNIQEEQPIADESVARVEGESLKGWVVGLGEDPVYLTLIQKKNSSDYSTQYTGVVQEQVQSIEQVFNQTVETEFLDESAQRLR